MRSLFFVVIALVSFVSISSHASIGLISRADYVNVRTTKSNNLPVDLPGSSDFVLSMVKLNGSAKIADGEMYLTLDPTAVGGLAFDGSSGFLDTLFFMKKFHEDWWFKFGRLPNMTGGFEALQIDNGDDHWGSLANLNGPLDPNAPSGSRANRLGNNEGLAIGFDTEKTSLEIQVLNDIDSGNDPDTSPNTANSIGAVFTRNFKENFWVKLHYFFYTIDDAATDVDMIYRGVGLRWKEGRHDVMFDYLSNGYIDQAVSTDEDLTNSMVLNYHFAWTEQKVPFLKVEYSELVDKPSNAFDMKRTAFTVGMDYIPKASEPFRYHVALVSVTDDYKTDRDVTQPRVIAGLKYEVDLLK